MFYLLKDAYIYMYIYIYIYIYICKYVAQQYVATVL